MRFESSKNDFSIDFCAVIKHYNVVNDMVYSSGQKISNFLSSSHTTQEPYPVGLTNHYLFNKTS